MKIEDQVCSLEYAEKIKKLGVPQKSYFYWIHWREGVDDISGWGVNHMENDPMTIDVSAFTVAELGEMLKGFILPKWSKIEKSWLQDIIRQFSCSMPKDWIYSDTEANARAKMLIWLIKNKKVDVKFKHNPNP